MGGAARQCAQPFLITAGCPCDWPKRLPTSNTNTACHCACAQADQTIRRFEASPSAVRVEAPMWGRFRRSVPANREQCLHSHLKEWLLRSVDGPGDTCAMKLGTGRFPAPPPHGSLPLTQDLMFHLTHACLRTLLYEFMVSARCRLQQSLLPHRLGGIT